MTYTFKLARRMANNHPGRRAVAALAVLVLAACGGASPTGPSTPTPPVLATAGVLTMELATPNANDGAVQFAVSGPAIDSIRPIGYDGTTAALAGQAQTILTGSLTSGAVARVYVRDIARANEYRAWVVAAAARGSYQLQDVGSYRAVLVR
ncbi:MAG: hypothetical protein SFU84_04590 [Gemmatimonadales bacterium]|nr:hypothetical protein [Gemmatimonadales bacterium]